MSNQSIDLAPISASHPTKNVNSVKAYVAYNKGRGYILSLTPGFHSSGNGFNSFECDLFGWKGGYNKIAEGARFNRKTLESLALTVKETEIFKTMIAELVAQGVEVSDEPFVTPREN